VPDTSEGLDVLASVNDIVAFTIWIRGFIVWLSYEGFTSNTLLMVCSTYIFIRVLVTCGLPINT
jgi:hypothetical protein